ncbi:MAG: ATP-binding protein [Actinomycetota bacterium]|nr:ATP-binding protein [Actinomycetota bacterium]
MRLRLVLVMTAIAAGVAIALAIPMAIVISTDLRSSFVSQLEVDTLATAVTLASQSSAEWPTTIAKVAQRTGARVVIVDEDRSLIADSANSTTDRSFDRPEIVQALHGTLTSSVRPSATLGSDLRYVAAPIVKQEQVSAAVRLSLPEDDVIAVVHRSQLFLVVFVLAVMFLAAMVALLLSRSITAPLSRLAAVARGLPDNLNLRAQDGDGPAEVQAVAGALNQTADRLSGILEHTQAVAAEASHHLKTPLTSIRLRLEAIEDLSEQEQVRVEAERATSEVDRLTHRIDQVLELARNDAGVLHTTVSDASAVIADRTVAAAVIAEERNLELRVALAPHVSVGVSSPILARIVDELLGNAFDYAQSQVRVSLAEVSRQAVLTVEDDGPGISVQEAELIFQRFMRGKGANSGGSGLGLALVRETARASGGNAVALASVLGGLEIRVSWPLALAK